MARRRSACDAAPDVTADRWHVRGVALPGGGEPLDWWIADGRLSSQPIDGAAELPGAWIAAGLVDAHAHLSFEARDRLGLERGSDELIAAHLAVQRCAGVLAVRDAGSLPGIELARHPACGGRVIACGPLLAPPDFFLAHLYEGTAPEDAVDWARQRVQAGGEWVKVITDYPADGDSPLAPRLGYPLDLLGAIVDAVHAEGGRVAAHVMGPIVHEVVGTAVDSIEHGNWATEEAVREMAHRGTAWTPTLTTVLGHIAPVAEHVPAARELLERQRRTLPLAAQLGVTLLAGTDEEPHGSLALEVAALADHGVPAADALAAATTSARCYLGLKGLVDGAAADLVTYARDPREDLGVLLTPAAVVCDGRVVAGVDAGVSARASGPAARERPPSRAAR
jgi:imidazolonepropionase-like amidohydrolase